MKAIWNNQIIAESTDIVDIEGNSYFPIQSIHKQYFSSSDTHTTCPWKGEASYYTITVNGKTNEDAAWYYPTPSNLASSIKDRVAFWKGVEVTD